MNAVPFKPEHLATLRVQGVQAIEFASLIDVAHKIALTDAWTILDAEKPLFCGGLVPAGDTGLLWALLSPAAGARMFAITRMTARFLSRYRGRVETWVRPDFVPACRWAEMFGLKRQDLAPYGVDGSNYYRYVGDL